MFSLAVFLFLFPIEIVKEAGTMGLISTVNIFALLVAPTAVVVRGYDVKWKQSMLFAVLHLSLQLAVLFFESAHQLFGVFVLQASAPSIVARAASLSFVAFVLRDRRLSKLLGIQRLESRSALAVGVSVANGLLHCIGPLYQVASSPGFEIDVLFAAIHLNVAFIIALLQVEAFATASLPNVVLGIAFCGFLEAVYPKLDEGVTLIWYIASVVSQLAFLKLVSKSSKAASE
jgi:hypothetical protein